MCELIHAHKHTHYIAYTHSRAGTYQHEHAHSHDGRFLYSESETYLHTHSHDAYEPAGQRWIATEVDNEIPLEARHAAYGLICEALKCWGEGETLADINRMMQFVGAHAGALRDAKDALE